MSGSHRAPKDVTRVSLAQKTQLQGQKLATQLKMLYMLST